MVKEFEVAWVSENQVWKVVATVKENPALPGKVHAFRNVKIYRYGSVNYEKYQDDGRTPKYVMDKYREYMKLVYE